MWEILYCVELLLSLVFGALLLLSFFPIPGSNGDKLAELERHRERVHAMWAGEKKRQISIAEFKSQVRQGEKWCVVEHVVVDLGLFKHHPGGQFLVNFVGRDATPWFLIAHSKTEAAMRMVRAISVGVLECACWKEAMCECVPSSAEQRYEAISCVRSPLLDSTDCEYLAMHEKLRESGAFPYDHVWWCADLGETFFPIFFGLFLAHFTEHTWLGHFLVFVGACRQGMLFHDMGHHSILTRASSAKVVQTYLGLVILGLDFHHPTAIHQVHHAFVNVVGLDTALDIGPVKTHPSMVTQGKNARCTSSPRHLGVLQNVLFYGLLVWIVWPYYAFSAVFRDLSQREWANSVFKALRFAWCFCFFDFFAPLVTATVLGFVYFAITGSLNHFHKDMRTQEELFGDVDKYVSFVHLQSRGVQNTTSNAITDWFLGHFTLHIEHHLFPMLPRRRYNAIVDDVKRLVGKSGVRYSVTSQLGALSLFNRKLANPF